MTQPPSYPTPPVGGPRPTPGGVAPQPGPHPYGYAAPPQYAPPGYAPPQFYGGPPRPAAPPPTLTPGGQPLASFSDRLLAMLLDSAVFMVVGLVLAVPAAIIFLVVVAPDISLFASDGSLGEVDFFHDLMLPLIWIDLGVIAISLVLAYVYYVEMMFKTGQTFGKKMMNLRIVPLDPTRSLDRRAAAKRFLVQQLSGFFPGLSYLDGFWQLWDKPWQQCLHDKFAGTVVVKVSQ